MSYVVIAVSVVILQAGALQREATIPGTYHALLVEPAPYQVSLPGGRGLQLAGPLNMAGRVDFSTLLLGYSNERESRNMCLIFQSRFCPTVCFPGPKSLTFPVGGLLILKAKCGQHEGLCLFSPLYPF